MENELAGHIVLWLSVIGFSAFLGSWFGRETSVSAYKYKERVKELKHAETMAKLELIKQREKLYAEQARTL